MKINSRVIHFLGKIPKMDLIKSTKLFFFTIVPRIYAPPSYAKAHGPIPEVEDHGPISLIRQSFRLCTTLRHEINAA